MQIDCFSRAITFGFALVFSSSAAWAQIGFRQVTSTYPVAVQCGTKTTVQLRSNYTLDDTYAMFFDRPGIKMSYGETRLIAAPRRGRGSVGTPFRFHVEVPADQPPGVYEYRLATHKSVSSVAQLLVTELPVVTEAEKENGSLPAAQSVPVPSAVCGVCEKFEDVDCYRFIGQAGQELTFEVYAQRVADRIHNMVVRGPRIYLMDPILTLYGPGGQVVAQNDNFVGGDSFLYCKLPVSGDYTVEIRDARYAGNARYTYCVEISDRPYAYAIFPMAVHQGRTAQIEVIGHMLGGLAHSSVTGSGDLEPGWTEVRIETPRGPTNPLPLLVSPYPQLLESEGNDTIAEANPITPPVGAGGRMDRPNDTDYYSFRASKGEVFRFQVEAQRRGSPLDSVIELYDTKGRKLAESDDFLQTKDSRLFWTAPADGSYCVAVRDLHGRSGERFNYHLLVEPSGPDFEVHGEYYYAFLAPGTRMTWFARVERLNGFDGPVSMDVEGLPEGVSCTPVTIPPGMKHCSLILLAAPDAKIGASLVRVCGKAEIPGRDGELHEVVRYGRVTCEVQSSGGGQARWPIETQIVGVTEPLDLICVEAAPDEITLRPGEEAEIKVHVERAEGFTEPVTLDMAFTYFSTKFGEQLPPGVQMSPKSKTRLAGKVLDGLIVLEADTDALPVERLPIAVVARVPITFSITTNYASNPIYLTVNPAKSE